MHRGMFFSVFGIAVLSFFLASGLSFAREATDFSDLPSTLKVPAKKWRLAYYEGGDSSNYMNYLEATVQGLKTLGWVSYPEIPPLTDSASLWQWLAKNVSSDYLEFVTDAFYTGAWEENKREATQAAVLQRLNREGDIDFIFAMGTWAGQDLANNLHHVPTFVLSTSDPLGSGIIKSVTDSGYDHVFARVSPQRYERQLRLFHEIIGFKRLGVAFEDTEDGRAYTAMDGIERLAEEQQFEIVPCHTLSDVPDNQLAIESVISCMEQLVLKVDAIYITQQGGVNNESIAKIVDIANAHNIPTFSQLGADEVKYGVLMSMSRSDFHSVGQFLASSMGKVLNGASPRKLKQLFEDEMNISLNLKTAERIGIYLRADWLAAVDKIYPEIEVPE